MDDLIKEDGFIEDLKFPNSNSEYGPKVKRIKESEYPSEAAEGVLKCENCDYTTLQEDLLKIHEKAHVVDKSVPAKNASENPIQEESSALNESEETDAEPAFEFCDCETTENLDGDSHSRSVIRVEKILLTPEIEQKRVVLDNIFTCKLCNYKTLQEKRFKVHVKTHINSTCFKCTECDYITPNKRSLYVHKINHVFRCYTCDYKASSLHHLSLHMKTHIEPDNESTKCSYCQYETNRPASLAFHTHRHLNGTLPRSRVATSPNNNSHGEDSMPFQCAECSYKTLRKDYLDRHVAFHRKTTSLECEECGQKFALQRSLVLHRKNHAKPKN